MPESAKRSKSADVSERDQMTRQEKTDRDTCRTVITRAVSSAEGIVQVDLDLRRHQAVFNYDTSRVSEPFVRQVAQGVALKLRSRPEGCAATSNRSADRCKECVAEESAGADAAADPDESGNNDVQFEDGVLSLQYSDVSGERTDSIERVQLDIGDEDHQEAATNDGTVAGRVIEWAGRQRWELIFTVVTFVAMGSAWIVGKTGGPSSAATALYVVAYLTGGVFGVRAGVSSLMKGVIDVDLLMVLAALGAALVGSPFEGVLLLFLFSLSNVLQDFAMDRTRNAIRSLMKLRPHSVSALRNGKEQTVGIADVAVGEYYVVRPGDRLALDGEVVEGEGSVDQAFITGESMPVAKKLGDTVLAGTINKNGNLTIRVTKSSKDSTISKVIKLVEDAQESKARTQRFLDTAEQYYAVGVIVATALAVVIPYFILGHDFDTTFYRAMTLMVAASPCALIISTPASILSAIGNGARRGILFKGGVYLEQAATIRVVAFDKTGTLTEGRPQVTDVRVFDTGTAEKNTALWHGEADDLLGLAAGLESKSEHALARATVEAARRQRAEMTETLAFEATSGKGVRGLVDGREIRVGNIRYFDDLHCVNCDRTRAEVEALRAEGQTVVLVAQVFPEDGTAVFLGAIAYADVIRATSANVVRQLRELGVQRIVLLTGDHDAIGRRIGDTAGVDEVFSDLMPEDKLRIIGELEERYGPVAMIGDGVNDAPALARASIGIAMGAAGTDVALETADVVLMADDLTNIPYVIALSRRTRRTLVFNLGLAMGLIAVMIAGIFSVGLALPLAVVGHEGGTVLVSLNGLRLLLFRWQPQVGGRASGASG